MKWSMWWILSLLGLDQLSKWLVLTYMELGQSIPVIGTFFQLTSHRNRGAAFGILQNQRLFFLVVTSLMIIGLAIWWWRTRDKGPKWLTLGLAMMIGGALGNWIDRARMGEVVDFFHFHFKWDLAGWQVDYVYPLFNIADSAIVIGALLLIWTQLREPVEGSNDRLESATKEEGQT
jgi:signal peptidase II